MSSILQRMQETSNKIGGKGTMRRPVKRPIRSNIKGRIKTPNEHKIDGIIRLINKELTEMDIDTYHVAWTYLDDEVNFFIRDTPRCDVKKKKELDNIKLLGDTFLENYLTQKGEQRDLVTYNYDKLTEIFQSEGIDNFIEFLKDIECDIRKRNFSNSSDDEES